jgi:hypothetical protein
MNVLKKFSEKNGKMPVFSNIMTAVANNTDATTGATAVSNTNPTAATTATANDYGKKLWKTFLKLFRMDTFKTLVSLLLFMAYLMFALSTILFVNAIINFHKTADNKPKKLKDLSIFEYLKSDNFMFLDTAILNFNTSILFKVIIGIVSGAVGLLAIHLIIWYSNKENGWAEFDTYYKKEKNSFEVYMIAGFIYIYYLLIIAPLYATHIATNLCVLDDCLINYKKENKNIIPYTKSSLNAIKKQIQQRIYSGNENYVETEYEAYKKVNDKENKDKDKGVEIDIPSIFLIYKNNLARKGSVEDRRQYAREYINYMDEYFALLGRKGRDAAADTDYYQAFYLAGLIEYDDDNDITKHDGAIYVLHTEFIKKLKDDIVPKIKIYFMATISLYTFMCVVILFLLFMAKESMKKMVVEFVYSVSSSKPKIFAIGSVVLIVIALGFTYGILRMVEYIWALKNIFIS